MAYKVLDISINDEGEYWKLYIPIATGHLSIGVKHDGSELDWFFQTAYDSPPRRMGDNNFVKPGS